MRLIDVDVLIADLEYDVELDARAIDCLDNESRRDIIQFDKDCKQNAIDLLRKAPTAQPEQVCVANVALTDEQVKEVVEKAKNAVISVIELEPHWIPCSKRLPETYGAYLVQDVCGGIFVDYWRGYWLAKTTMVAWMELPEPYYPSCGADMRGDEND